MKKVEYVELLIAHIETTLLPALRASDENVIESLKRFRCIIDTNTSTIRVQFQLCMLFDYLVFSVPYLLDSNNGLFDVFCRQLMYPWPRFLDELIHVVHLGNSLAAHKYAITVNTLN